MGRADYYKHGDANAICDRCGFKFKHSELTREWTGLLVCGSGGNLPGPVREKGVMDGGTEV